MGKKKEEELNPIAIKQSNFNIKQSDLTNMIDNINKFNIEIPKEETNETFYKLAIKELFNDKNIEQKTEWLNTNEVFAAVKLTFLGKFADIPMSKEFIEVLESKRISLNRKGREEIVLSLQERRQEELETRKAQLGLFGNPGNRL